ncbi:helix-turn-helix domain-containing protein [Hymenobacter rubidus]|uniref:helix-turn-helix domain-containing protein n=1 Tax=Hymenobacter rubidus TaxID=1441626 RepID=UPI00191D6643|nr:helix-turn-helix domain-containing protein [Hymenobacter rubidus]
MSPHDIATKADLTALSEHLEKLLQAALPVIAAPDAFYSLEQAAEVAGVSVRTVRKWLTEGKYDEKGKRFKLFALEFSPGYPRIPRSALLAYGRGLAFDASQLLPEQLPPMRVAS